MVSIIQIGTKKVISFRDLKTACTAMGWNYNLLKKKDLSSAFEYRGYFIKEK